MGLTENNISIPDSLGVPEGLPVIPQEDHLERLIDDVNAVCKGGKIRLYCGEGNPEVYSNSRLIGALQTMKFVQKARIQVILGPVAIVDKYAFNGLLHMKRNSTVPELYQRPTRGNDHHYYYVETRAGARFSLQLPHPPLTKEGDKQEVNLQALYEGDQQELVYRANLHFDSWLQFLKGKEELSLITTAKWLSKAMIEAEARGGFDRLDRESLFALPGKLIHVDEPIREIKMRHMEYEPEPLPKHKVVFVDITRNRGHHLEIELEGVSNLDDTIGCAGCGSQNGKVNLEGSGFNLPDLNLRLVFVNIPKFRCFDCGAKSELTRTFNYFEGIIRHLQQELRDGTNEPLITEEIICNVLARPTRRKEWVRVPIFHDED